MTEPIPAALLKLWYWVSVIPMQVNACTILERINQETETAVNIKKVFERNRTCICKQGISLEKAQMSLRRSTATRYYYKVFSKQKETRTKNVDETLE